MGLDMYYNLSIAISTKCIDLVVVFEGVRLLVVSEHQTVDPHHDQLQQPHGPQELGLRPLRAHQCPSAIQKFHE